MQTLRHTNIYRYISWPKFVINTLLLSLLFENTFIKHYINIVYSRYLFAEQMHQLQSSCVCVFTITSLKQHDIPSSPTSAAGSVEPTTPNEITQHPRSEKLQHVSVSFLSLRYSIIMLVSMWAPMNTTSQLFALAITRSDKFYRYIAIEYCIYLQCVHNQTANSDAIRSSWLWQETTEEGVHARRVTQLVFGGPPLVRPSQIS